ncbi:DNA repair protein complementing XP-C cells homolog [Drosophila guanche]|uniref:DNA repair protein complementing XP-C cells homolog n=1 Tax=Drosophila guanche TaxID=7266 RepID=UPI001471A5B8|nr:DNA repair protein complementing XP-C cells homolog [Drosophila guanche]
MSDEEDESVSEGFSASEDEWKPNKDARGGESSDDDDSDFDEMQPAGAAASAGPRGRSSAGASKKRDQKPPSGIKGASVKKRKPSGQSLRSKLYNKYRPPPKTFPTSPSQQNSPSASGSKNARTPNESGAQDRHYADSSSECSVDDYLVNPADLDLRSSFFSAQPSSKDKSPVPQFDCNAGIKAHSDSGSEDNNDSSVEDTATHAFDFRGLLENANSLERTRDALANRGVTAASAKNRAATMDVNALLALGENPNQNYAKAIDADKGDVKEKRPSRRAAAEAPSPPMDGPPRLSKTKSTRIKRHTKTRPVSTVVAAAQDTDDSDFEEVAGRRQYK